MISSIDIAWLAGILEGEGCFISNKNKYPVIAIGMTDKDIILRARNLMNFRSNLYVRRRVNSTHKLLYSIRVNGKIAVGWMMTVYKFMSSRRKEKIRSIINNWKSVEDRISLLNREVCKRGHILVNNIVIRSSFNHLSSAVCKTCARLSSTRAYRVRKAKGKIIGGVE